ncbi:PREDICTED: uncharacterized protein LOC106323382 [Brassica oleracea var. oleracea]|uniref:uncharacterized protein LOC106323382 n=1 Tax=Brassica oleracea var. oleracea TaxID=109376 RepID=UPI0006A6E498|nr:PREDICTED: uncharacterized protein LOC106323382 [Brassica oleracea var. oleracea]
MFIWRVGQNAFPTGENLQKRGLLIPTLCCRCGESETTLHLLINCPFAREVWSLGPWSHTFDASQVVSFKEALISSGSWIPLPPYGFTINIFPWVCWFLWISRNNLVFEKKPSTAPEIVLKAIIALMEWDRAQSKIRKTDSPQQIITHSTSHENLHPTSICCNTDAAWRSDTGEAGLFWIFTDLQGKEITRGSLFQEHVSSARMAEALAIRNTLHHAINLNLNTIWLKSDSQELIGAITAGRHPTELYGVLSDIAAFSLSSSFSCRFSFIKRELNGHADLYAKACLHSGSSPSSYTL